MKIVPSNLRCIIFDFAFTLSSDHFGNKYEAAYGKFVFGEDCGHISSPWMEGRVSSHDIAEFLASKLELPPKIIHDDLIQSCVNFKFNPEVWDFALAQRQAGRKTAIVTINADVFTKVIVPAHNLENIFDVIVNSADYGEPCKEVLWQMALDKLGSEYSFSDCLLIDDAAHNVQRFQELGGCSYLYTGVCQNRSIIPIYEANP